MLGVMPWIGKKLEAVSPDALPIDLMIPTYPPKLAVQTVQSYTEAGRALYQKIELTADVIYPIIYGLAFACCIAWGWSKKASPQNWIYYLPLIPVFTVLADFLENTCIVILLNQYPEPSLSWATLAAIASGLKWTGALLSITAMIGGLFVRFSGNKGSR